MLKISSNKVYINGVFSPKTLSIDNGKIVNIVDGIIDPDVNYEDNKIIPGMVDIHCHGYLGLSCNNATEEGLIKWIEDLPKEGCTSILASTSTGDEKDILDSFATIAKVIDDHPIGAEVLGIHVEGPYISFAKAGAQNKYEIRKPSAIEIEKWQAVAKGNIKLCCIAPEMDRDHEMIKYCSSHGIRVALGHTNATFEESMSAIKDGATDFTHTYNGMSQLGHRSPGAVGAAMVSNDAYAELIADGIHVHPAAALALAKCKGKDKLVIVTDSVSVKGFESGIYENEGDKIIIHDNGSITKPDGTLSGSANKMINLLKNSIEVIGIDEETAINAVTKNPCELLGITNKGRLDINCDADLVIIDGEYNVLQTYCLGKEMINSK